MQTAADVTPAAQTIRSYLDENGPTVVPFHHLLTSWELPDDVDSETRQQIVSDLAEAGVCVDRPLTNLRPEDDVALSLRKTSPSSIPALPYVGPAQLAAVPTPRPSDAPLVHGGDAQTVVGATSPPAGYAQQTFVGAPAPYAQPGASGVPAPPKSWVRRTLIGLFAVLAIGLAAGGAFLAGQSTRLSEQQVDAKLATQARQDKRAAKTHEALAIKDAKAGQRAIDSKISRKRLNKAVKKAREAGYSSGSAVGYQNGNAAGYQSGTAAGHEAGVQDGLKEGSDELTCSDDMDVPLPACNF
jgi:hypothetical protein